MKSPRYGNCSTNDSANKEIPIITFEEFKTTFKQRNQKSHSHRIREGIEEKLEKYIDAEDIDISNVIEIDDLMSEEMNTIVIYYLCGFICKKCKRVQNARSVRMPSNRTKSFQFFQ